MLSFSVFGAYVFVCAFLASFIIMVIRDSEPVDFFRILSGASALVAISYVMLYSAGRPPLREIACSLILSDAVILMAPSRHESGTVSLVLTLLMTTAFFVLLFLHLLRCELLFDLIVVPVLLDIIFKARQKYSRVRALFRREQVGFNIIDYSSLFYGLMLTCTIALCFLDKDVLIPVSCLASIVLYILIYKNSSRGHSIFVGRRKALVVESLLTGSLREPDLLGSPEDSRMNRLYRALVLFMKREKPYLDPNLNLETLAKRMMTNRVYLSRTINAFSGVGYTAFVNKYRVEHAQNLIAQNPMLRSDEVAKASGFQVESTFSRVFKQITGETPSAYIKDMRSRRSLRGELDELTAHPGPGYLQGLPEGLEGPGDLEDRLGRRPGTGTSSRRTY